VRPMGLEHDGVDLLEIDGFGLVAHGFDHGSDAEVAGGSVVPKLASPSRCARYTCCENCLRLAPVEPCFTSVALGDHAFDGCWIGGECRGNHIHREHLGECMTS
jgi:hypothetical protein